MLQQSRHNEHTHFCGKIRNFLKMRGGVKGRLEFFRKFIRFGGADDQSYILVHGGYIVDHCGSNLKGRVQ